ncbi:MAG: ABC transporter permease, partial [Lachnospiraceae bacterium]|nr:ABC transporter permease [Lachnospiraceae bacterium]
MYFRTLKKDLKRQKTMNIILLLFTVIASMFVSSGMSNVVSVMNGTEYFMSKAGVGDHMIFTQKGDGGVEEILKKSPNVTGYRVEHCYWVDREAVMVDDRIVDSVNNILIVQSIQDSGISLFDRYNKKLEKVNKGEVFVTTGFLKRNNVNIGDVLTIHLGGTERAFKITGEFKDSLFGSDMMGNTRLVINEEEFAEYENNEKLDEFSGRMFNIETDDLNKLGREVSSAKNVLFSAGKDTFKLCYIMEMISAFVVFVLSVCLVVVSFVLLKFVISFSITEEYREIGVMKAIGIRNSRIRNIYIIKYFVIALIGGIIGFVLGIPLGNVLIASVSEKMVLGNDSGIAINMTGSTIVVLVMIGFVYMCTGKIKKVTPVDAIRNGQTGERYKKKRRHSIQKSHFGNAFYMAINDVLSSPKRYVTIILAFFICSIFVFGLVETTDTMKSDRLIRTFCKKSDVYINDTKLVKWTDISKEGNKNIENTVKNLEDDLVEMGMPGKVAIEVWYNYPISFEGDTLSFT